MYRYSKIIKLFFIFLNVLILLFIITFLFTKHQFNNRRNIINKLNVSENSLGKVIKRHPQDDVTFVVRSFESFENDLVETVKSISFWLPEAPIFVVTDTTLYPPLILNPGVKILNRKASLTNNFKERNPLLRIKTKYTFFIPDSTRLSSHTLLDKLINISINQPGKLIAVPYKGYTALRCLNIDLDIRQWQVRFYEYLKDIKECHLVKGKHALFVETVVLLNVSDSFMLPFPESLYIQSSFNQIKVTIAKNIFLSNGRELFTTNHLKWKVKNINKQREQLMFQNLELKKVIRENGAVEWYGCRRDTPRCFGSIIDETPQYLWDGKWTPPCCLAGLRTTARHVFEQLEDAKVRYWLEGGSLLGAMRNNDILPWDYDVDIGIYREDIHKCIWLMKSASKPITDFQGFVWEKAVEGDFYRVQFSQINRLHVDIFPFYSRNGTMTKDTWFKTHQQDREFPEHYLKPLSSIEFVGRMVSAPNNIHDFLELKFGVGVIENPEYPNPLKMLKYGLPYGPA